MMVLSPWGLLLTFVWFNLPVSSIFFGVFFVIYPIFGWVGFSGSFGLTITVFSALSRGMPANDSCVARHSKPKDSGSACLDHVLTLKGSGAAVMRNNFVIIYEADVAPSVSGAVQMFTLHLEGAQRKIVPLLCFLFFSFLSSALLLVRFFCSLGFSFSCAALTAGNRSLGSHAGRRS